MNSETRQTNYDLWSEWQGWSYLLVGLTILLRLIHIWISRSNPTFWAPAIDPQWYDSAAMNILQGNFGPFPLFRAPVYPVLLSGVYAIFGHDLTAARLLNVVLQAATAWTLLRIGRTYFTAWIGIIAAALFTFNGMAIFFAGEIVSPSAEMLASALVFWAILHLFHDHSNLSIAICGLACGLAAITRPNFLFIFPAALLAVLWAVRQTRRLPQIAIWLACALLPILPITAANYVKGGELVLIATQGGVNFWIGNNPDAAGYASVLPGYGNTWTMADAEDEAQRAVGRKLNSGEVSDFYTRKTWDFVTGEPMSALKLMIRKIGLFFNHFEISNNKHIDYFSRLTPGLPFLQWLNYGLLVPLSLLGFWVMWKRPEVKLILIMTMCYAASVVIFFVTARFRMPTVPWLSLIAAIALTWIIDTLRMDIRARKHAPLLLILPGLAIAYTSIWNSHEPSLGWARSMEGNAYLRLNQLDSAKAAFEDALRYSPNIPLTHVNLGVIEFRKENPLEAMRHYQDALHWDPNCGQALNNLGTVYETLGDTNQAVENYRHALAIRPYDSDARFNLASLYFQQANKALKSGNLTLATAYYDSCNDISPSPTTHYNLAVALLGGERHVSKARAELEAALHLEPNYTPALRLKAMLEDSAEFFAKVPLQE